MMSRPPAYGLMTLGRPSISCNATELVKTVKACLVVMQASKKSAAPEVFAAARAQQAAELGPPAQPLGN